MKRIKQIAYELSVGNIEEASKLQVNPGSQDGAVDIEVLEVARQSLIGYLKRGEFEKACSVKKLFDLPDDLAQEAVKHAVISSYYDGNLSRMLEISKRVPMTDGLFQEIIGYCESWGRNEEAKAMREVFVRC